MNCETLFVERAFTPQKFSGDAMSQMIVDLPDAVSKSEAKLLLAARLFEIGRLSSGQAAAVAGYSKRTFLELLGKLGVPVFDYQVDELTEDLRHV